MNPATVGRAITGNRLTCTIQRGTGLSSKGTPQKHFRWRVVAGDRPGLRRRRWPVAVWGSGLTEVPGRGARKHGPGDGVFVTRMMVVAESTTWLRHLLDEPVSLTRTRRVSIVVDSWRSPQRAWSGRLGPLSHLLAHRIRMPVKDGGAARIDIELRWSVPLRTVLAAVLPVLAPVRPMPAPASPDIIAQDVFPAWLGAQPNAEAIAGELPGNDDIRPHDLVLTATGEPRPPVEPDLPGEVAQTDSRPEERYAAVLAADAFGIGAGQRPEMVLIDAEHAVPSRRYGPFGPDVPSARLSFTGSDGRGWQITGAEGVVCGGSLARPWLTEQVREALSEIGTVHCPTVPARHPLEETALLLHLVMTGVLVHAPDLPPACQAHLTDEVRDLLRTAPAQGHEAELGWEVHAVRLRRAALRGHATRFALPRLAAGAFPGLQELPSVSALLVTRRLEHVLDALAMIESQTYPNLEIVLCLHGVELPAEMRDRVARSSRPVEVLTLPAEHGFGEAIGVATAHARGSLVAKFDDDDTYGPEHVWDLVLARHHSGAVMVGKGAEFVYLQTLETTVRRDAGLPEAFTAVVAGGTMLIGRGDLEEVGGWRPVPRSIDRGLIDRVRRAGGLIYRTHPLGYVYHRRSGGHTWDPGLEYFLRGGGMQWSGLPRHPEFGTHLPSAEAGGAGAGPAVTAAVPVAGQPKRRGADDPSVPASVSAR